MQNIKKLGLVIAIVVVLIALVMARTLNDNQFKNDTGKWTGPSIDQSNLITTDRLNTLSEEQLIVDITDKGEFLKNYKGAIHIPANSLADKLNQKKLRTHKGSILLISNDQAQLARMWMFLSQLGYTNLYILTENSDNEILKYNFIKDSIINQPDDLAGAY